MTRNLGVAISINSSLDRDVILCGYQGPCGSRVPQWRLDLPDTSACMASTHERRPDGNGPNSALAHSRSLPADLSGQVFNGDYSEVLLPRHKGPKRLHVRADRECAHALLQ